MATSQSPLCGDAGTIVLRNLIKEGRDGDVVTIIANRSVNFDDRDEGGQSYLMLACEAGHVNIVSLLLEQAEVYVDAVDNEKWTALLYASLGNHKDIIGVLKGNGANLEHRDMAGWTALSWAVFEGHLESVTTLLEAGANANVKGDHYVSCLAWAAGRGYTRIVQQLVSHGANLNMTDKFGTTPLIWAARNGHHDIVSFLLNSGADIDSAGMHLWTALIVATKGGHLETFDCLMENSPNVNSVDKDGFSSLTWACKEGLISCVRKLLEKGAYVNIVDRHGESVLMHAVKAGHESIVRLLLIRYAELNFATPSSKKTSLYVAVEKGYNSVAKLLIEKGANIDNMTKEGDTALMKAVRTRNSEMVQLLLDKSAKVNICDKLGDTALHIAIRCHNKRITEAVLRNPKNSRLLYKPNKAGYTPHQIDAMHNKSILAQIFGTRQLNREERTADYDLYSNTIADVLSEPELVTPITVGLYAKWGSGKSFLIDSLRRDIKGFTSETNLYTLTFCFLQFYIFLIISLIVGSVLTFKLQPWYIGASIGVGVFIFQYIMLGVLILLGKNFKSFEKISSILGWRLRSSVLMSHLLFRHMPKDKHASAVHFLFTESNRLRSTYHQSFWVTQMVISLFETLEKEYGKFIMRFFWVFRPQEGVHPGSLTYMCCIPKPILVLIVILAVNALVVMLCIEEIRERWLQSYILIILVILSLIAVFALIWLVINLARILFTLVYPPQSRLVDLSEAHAMSTLKQYVQFIVSITKFCDCVLQSKTRLTLVVDGLDSCDQEVLLSILDSVHQLFGEQPDTPFVSLLAVDPHIIIKVIERNLRNVLNDSSVTGHDYLRNLVQLPFFVQNRSNIGFRKSSIISLRTFGSRQSLRMKSRQTYSNSNVNTGSTVELNYVAAKDTYFSDLNPRNLRRLMNIVAVSGRLLRAHNFDVNWQRLVAWTNLIEQWPYHIAWMLIEIEDNQELNDNTELYFLFLKIQPKLPTNKEFDPLLEIDKNPRKLKLALSKGKPSLNVGDIRRFIPSTINFDPYLLKLVRENKSSEINASCVDADYVEIPPGVSSFSQLPNRNYENLFPMQICAPSGYSLMDMDIKQVCDMIESLPNLDKSRLTEYQKIIQENNISGPVLLCCEPTELRPVLNMTFGDWEMFKICLKQLKNNYYAKYLKPCRKNLCSKVDLAVNEFMHERDTITQTMQSLGVLIDEEEDSYLASAPSPKLDSDMQVQGHCSTLGDETGPKLNEEHENSPASNDIGHDSRIPGMYHQQSGSGCWIEDSLSTESERPSDGVQPLADVRKSPSLFRSLKSKLGGKARRETMVKLTDVMVGTASGSRDAMNEQYVPSQKVSHEVSVLIDRGGHGSQDSQV